MKVLIMNGPRSGDVVDVPADAPQVVLLDPLPPQPITSFEDTPPIAPLATARTYLRGTVSREAAADLLWREGATGIIYDPVLAKQDEAEEAARKAKHDYYAAMDPDERRAHAIEESVWHEHCESCIQDGEYPCCAAWRMAIPEWSSSVPSKESE